jgi:predicted mannosyl-3-phosphoglycerate phosphatase (HAD superfamily)
MIIYENGEYTPCTYRVTLQNRGVEDVHYTNFRTYWENMVAKHDHLTNLNFEEVTFSAEQDARLQEISGLGIPQGFQSQVREYVETGNFPDGYDHPLASLKINKEQSDQNKEIADAFFEIMKVVT